MGTECVVIQEFSQCMCVCMCVCVCVHVWLTTGAFCYNKLPGSDSGSSLNFITEAGISKNFSLPSDWCFVGRHWKRLALCRGHYPGMSESHGAEYRVTLSCK